MSGTLLVIQALLQASSRAQAPPSHLAEAVEETMLWLEDRYRELTPSAREPGAEALLEALDLYHRSLEHLMLFLLEGGREHQRSALLLAYQAEDQLGRVEGGLSLREEGPLAA